jgi:hypothetical protein
LRTRHGACSGESLGFGAEAVGRFRGVGHRWREASLASTHLYDDGLLIERETIALDDGAEATPNRAREENVEY